MENTVVKIENLVKRYKETLALDHFNLEIKEGEIFGLLGPNGSGKTTTMNCILALLTYDKGSVEVFGGEMNPDNIEAKRNIGVVMQNVAVYDELTVYENIDYFCGLYVKDKATRKNMLMKPWILLIYRILKSFIQRSCQEVCSEGLTLPAESPTSQSLFF